MKKITVFIASLLLIATVTTAQTPTLSNSYTATTVDKDVETVIKITKGMDEKSAIIEVKKVVQKWGSENTYQALTSAKPTCLDICYSRWLACINFFPGHPCHGEWLGCTVGCSLNPDINILGGATGGGL